ncbi:hypothetical protein HKD37_18G051229 [Glycine soja]
MKTGMEAMKEQMEVMMSMKKIMEVNAAAIAATSTIAEVDLTPPYGLNQINPSTLDMVGLEGEELEADFEACLGYATEGQAVGGIPLQNTLEGPQYHPQPHPLHSTVAITPARFPQPPFFRGYDLNATCAYHGGALGHSIEHCMTLKHKVQSLIDVGWLKFEENRFLNPKH